MSHEESRRLALTCCLCLALAMPPAVLAQVSPPAPAPATLGGRISLLGKNGERLPGAQSVVWLPGLRVESAGAATAVMTSRDKRFDPRVVVVRKGGSVAFPNVDRIYHNVFSRTPGSSFDLGLYRKGASRSQKLGSAGLVRVFCNIHPNMAAYVMVIDGDLFAVSADDGSFRIPGIPPGSHAVRVWNERGGESQVMLDFAAGKSADWNPTLDGSQWKLEPHKNKHGQDYPKGEAVDRY